MPQFRPRFAFEATILSSRYATSTPPHGCSFGYLSSACSCLPYPVSQQRFGTVNKEISEQKEDMARLQDKERELHDAIVALQKDVQGHKKEIRDREETVVDKEARIYDLKKKNQELEKFKFVLNYKIQVCRVTVAGASFSKSASFLRLRVAILFCVNRS
jgi:septal ring factor EnvC (AmiA/AmiB activator)